LGGGSSARAAIEGAVLAEELIGGGIGFVPGSYTPVSK
jgi:hypothetical protein